jgi:23S rRNA (cytidine1920-2'-O)/16S rRNA (cytidine1409-2'-O)-methyltransferase
VTSRRLDEALVGRRLAQSRARARDAVLRGHVTVNGQPARKASQSVRDEDVLAVLDPAQHYVSRAALKLLHALDHFSVDVNGHDALDIGASTGGFTQVLLERGAAHVTAIDVGHGQLGHALVNNPKITLREGLNARDITREDVPANVTLIVCDVSFISVKLALPASLSLMPSNAKLIALIKPQFEVGRDHVGKGGIVTDEAQQQRVCDETENFLADQGWTVKGVIPSPLEGGDGNKEFLIMAVKM